MARFFPDGTYLDGLVDWIENAVGALANLLRVVQVGDTTRLGVNTSDPQFAVHVVNNEQTSLALEAYGAEPSYPVFYGRRARGVAGAGTATQSGDHLVWLAGRGHGASGFGGSAAALAVVAAENFTDSAQGAEIKFETTPTGSTSRVECARFIGDGSLQFTKAACGVANSVNSSITAAGTTISDATALTSIVNRVGTTPLNSGVKLPNVKFGNFVFIQNDGANALKVYPPDGNGNFNEGAGAGGAFSLPTQKNGIFFRTTDVFWIPVQLD